MRRILIFASSVLFLPCLVTAQHRGGMVGAGQPVAAPIHTAAIPAQRAGARVSTAPHAPTTAVGVHHVRVNGAVTHNVNGMSSRRGSVPEFPEDFENTPGLGFDFPHLAAVSPHRVRERFEGAFPFGFSGFLLSSPGMIVEEQQPVENQQPPAAETTATNFSGTEDVRGSEGRYLSGMVSLPAPELAPQPDAPEYVFVRRDGSLLFGVAYSWENGTLRYVTRDGLRRSVTQGGLDMDATQQFNEQRGVSFRSPA